MEVCQKCHEVIKEEDKFIVGDPHLWSGVVSAGLIAGANAGNKRNVLDNQPQTNNHKYHLECYKLAKKKDAKNAVWIAVFFLIFMLIILLIVFLVILK